MNQENLKYIQKELKLKKNRFSHDLRTEPCIYNSLGKCKFSAESCRFSHEKKVDVSVPCFFNLMGGCKNEHCENKHSFDNIIKYISYEGPIWSS